MKIEVNIISYSLRTSACEQRQWQPALALLSEMWVATLLPTSIGSFASSSTCEKGEQWQPAQSLLSEMWVVMLEPAVIPGYT